MRFLFFILAALTFATAAEARQPLTPNELAFVRSRIAARLSADPDNRSLRFQYVQASYQLGDFKSAKRNTDILIRTAESPQEVSALKRVYAEVVSKSPWTSRLGFSIIPSTNIDRTSSNEFFDTALGQLTIVGGGQTKTGVGFLLNGELDYTFALRDGSTLTLGASMMRRQFPAERMNFTEFEASLSWRKRTFLTDTQFGPFATRAVYDLGGEDANDWSSIGLSFSQDIRLAKGETLAGKISAERKDFDNSDYADGTYAKVNVTYTTVFGDSSYRFGFGMDRGWPEQEHLRFTAASTWAEVGRSMAGVGKASLNLGFGARRYEGAFPALGFAREDEWAAIGITFVSPKLRVWNSTPKFSCRFQKNWSNVALYEFQSTDCVITLDRLF